MFQVLGLCRFSYPAAGGFQAEHASVEERARHLYAPWRMEQRLRIFEAFTLPALQGQTDPDFTLLVVIGDDLPAIYQDRLQGLLAHLPQARLHKLPPGGAHRAVMQRVINTARQGDLRPCIQFRMDDDDAVATGFVADVRAAAADAAPLLARHRLAAIDFTRGHIARPTSRGILAEATVRQFWVPALSVIAQPGEALTVMNFNHVRLWHFMPTITLTQPDMFVRGISDSSDSALRLGQGATLLDKKGEAQFRQRYNICADRVRALYRGTD